MSSEEIKSAGGLDTTTILLCILHPTLPTLTGPLSLCSGRFPTEGTVVGGKENSKLYYHDCRQIQPLQGDIRSMTQHDYPFPSEWNDVGC